MRGRKPTPTKLKILRGNPGERPLNDKEPQPAAGTPDRPTWLKGAARKIWDALLPGLVELGVVTQIDGHTFAAFCQACAELDYATAILEKEGRIITSKRGGKRSHPAVEQQRSAMKAVKDFSALFGIDPSSRTRIKLPGSGNTVDPFEAFLSGKKGKAARGAS